MRHTRIRRLICIMAALAFLCGTAAAGTEFSFRGGVTWDMTSEQVLAAEGLRTGDYNLKTIGDYTYCYLVGKNVYYAFENDMLVQAYTVQPGGAYAAELERLTALYGMPAEGSADTAAALWNAVLPDSSIASGDLSAVEGWQLSDGTLAFLYLIDGGACTAFYDQQRILGGP
jgi:hypothetical protein